MAIDVHSHYVPPALLESVRRGDPEIPGVRLVQWEGHRFELGDRRIGAVPDSLLDLERRLLWMDEAGVETQVLAPWVELFGYHLPPAEGIAWSRLLNASMRETVAGSGRFAGLATVPMQEPAAAAEILAEAVDAGFPGVMVGTRAGESELDSAFFEPFWSAASELGAVVFLHPNSETGDPRLGAFGLANAVGRVHDTTVTAARLLYAGVPARFAGARIVLSHGGGTLPYVLGRLARNFSIDPELGSDPTAGFGRLYFDSVVSDPAALRLLVDKAGPGHVMLGSDYPLPIGDLDPLRTNRQARLGERAEEQVLEETARSVFSLADRG